MSHLPRLSKSLIKYTACAMLLISSTALPAHTAPVAGEFNYAESDVSRDVAYISMKNGTRLAYVSYRPKTGRHPTVFIYSPYTGNSQSFESIKPFLDAGYAVVGANWPGTGCSEGTVEHWFPDKVVGAYGAEIVEWIAEQPWSDGNVGMAGHSYDGSSQLWVAAERPPHLKAIVPTGLEDGYETMGYIGGMVQASLAPWEVGTKYATHSRGEKWRVDLGDTECTQIRVDGRQKVKHGYFDLMREHKFKDSWWDSVDPARAEVVGQITVPTMIVGASQDEWAGAAREGARIFGHLTPDLKNKKMILMNGNHSSQSFFRGYPFLRSEQIRFLDRWVRGIQNGVEEEPPVKIFWEVRSPEGQPKNAVAGWSTTHENWPDPKVQRNTFYLTTDGEISADQSSLTSEGSRSYLYPTGSELTGSNEQFSALPYESGVLNYRLKPVNEDTALLGNPAVDLFLSIDSGDDVDIEVTLKDVAPDGTVTFLQSGQHRASFQEIDHAQTYSDEIVYSFVKSEPLKVGSIYNMKFSFSSPIAHVLRKGHSLELTIGAPSTIPDPYVASIPIGNVSVNRVYHSQAHPSKITLPILPGATAQAEVPECGVLLIQPCRKQDTFIAGGLAIPQSE